MREGINIGCPDNARAPPSGKGVIAQERVING